MVDSIKIRMASENSSNRKIFMEEISNPAFQEAAEYSHSKKLLKNYLLFDIVLFLIIYLNKNYYDNTLFLLSIMDQSFCRIKCLSRHQF